MWTWSGRPWRGWGCATSQPAENRPGVTAVLGDVLVEDVAAELVRAGARVRGVVVERPDLEDLFVSLTGEGFDVVR